MRSRQFMQVMLRLVLAVSLVLPGIAAPAQAVTQAFATVAPDAHAGVMAQRPPCDGMSMEMPETPEGQPPGDCGRHGCDLAACLGAGCLPALPHVPAFVPSAGSLITWEQPLPPSRLFDTLLRPPIA